MLDMNGGQQTTDTSRRWAMPMQADPSICLLHKVESTKGLEIHRFTNPVPLYLHLH